MCRNVCATDVKFGLKCFIDSLWQREMSWVVANLATKEMSIAQ